MAPSFMASAASGRASCSASTRQTGATKWTTEGRGGTNVALQSAGPNLIALTTDGDLLVVRRTPERVRRAQALQGRGLSDLGTARPRAWRDPDPRCQCLDPLGFKVIDGRLPTSNLQRPRHSQRPESQRDRSSGFGVWEYLGELEVGAREFDINSISRCSISHPPPGRPLQEPRRRPRAAPPHARAVRRDQPGQCRPDSPRSPPRAAGGGARSSSRGCRSTR